jgi:hypothetical protein
MPTGRRETCYSRTMHVVNGRHPRWLAGFVVGAMIEDMDEGSLAAFGSRQVRNLSRVAA